MTAKTQPNVDLIHNVDGFMVVRVSGLRSPVFSLSGTNWEPAEDVIGVLTPEASARVHINATDSLATNSDDIEMILSCVQRLHSVNTAIESAENQAHFVANYED